MLKSKSSFSLTPWNKFVTDEYEKQEDQDGSESLTWIFERTIAIFFQL